MTRFNVITSSFVAFEFTIKPSVMKFLTPQPEMQKRSQDEFHITGNWSGLSVKLCMEYDMLSEEDVILHSGKEEELLERIARRLGVSREDVISLIQRLQHSV